jgi:hypothetical protein
MSANSHVDLKYKPEADWLIRPTPRQLLQRAAVHTLPDSVPAIVHGVLRSPGQPLDA